MASFPQRKTYTYQDLIKMSTEELKKVRKTLRDSTTRKIRKLNKKGVTSNPAIASLTKKITEGKVKRIKQIKLSKSQMKYLSKVEHTKKLKAELKQSEYETRQEIIKEALNYQAFNQSKTSTYKGWDEYQKYLNDLLGEGYSSLSKKEKSRFWELFEEEKYRIDRDLHDDSKGILRALSEYLKSRKAKHVGTKKDRKVLISIIDEMNDQRLKERQLANTTNDMMGRTQGFMKADEVVFLPLNK